MPFTFEFRFKDGVLCCRLIGEVTDEVLKDFFRTGSQHALREHPSAGVVDFSEVTSFDVAAQTIEQLAKAPPVLRDSNLRRVVIAPSPGIYGMMRMFQMKGSGTRPGLHVVQTEREARAILSVQDPDSSFLT